MTHEGAHRGAAISPRECHGLHMSSKDKLHLQHLKRHVNEGHGGTRQQNLHGWHIERNSVRAAQTGASAIMRTRQIRRWRLMETSVKFARLRISSLVIRNMTREKSALVILRNAIRGRNLRQEFPDHATCNSTQASRPMPAPSAAAASQPREEEMLSGGG